MRNVFEKRLNIILISALVLLVVTVGVPKAIEHFNPDRTVETDLSTEYVYTYAPAETIEATEKQVEVSEIKKAERSAMADKVKKDKNTNVSATGASTGGTEETAE